MKFSIVPVHAGIQWLGLANQTLRHQPLALLLLVGLLAIGDTLLSHVPLIGQPLCNAMQPLASLIVLIAAAESASASSRMSTSALLLYPFRAIRPRLRGLLALSAVHGIAYLLVLALVSSISESGFAYRYLENPRFTASAGSPDVWSKQAMNILTMPILLLAFAPALVHWHRASARQSIFSSAAACLRNWRACLLLTLLAVVLILPFGALAVLVIPPHATELTRTIVAQVCLLAPAALINIAWLFAFHDIFAAETARFAAPTGVAQA